MTEEEFEEDEGISTWKKLIDRARGDDKIIYCTLTESEMNAEFYYDMGCIEGKSFTAWSERYVYFPTDYDGREDVGRAPRDPCKQACDHFGGGG